MNPLSLAFVGDAVFSLYIRERLSLGHDFKSGKLTLLAAKIVSAAAQSLMYEALVPFLTEDELSIGKTARNSHTNNKAKNAALSDYKRATALEAVIGYLYLTGQQVRLDEILDKCFGVINESRG